MRLSFLIILLFILKSTFAYLDIQLDIKRQQNYISYAVPVKVNNVDYALSISFCDCKEFVKPLSEKMQSKKKKKHSKSQSKQMMGVIKASSLEGYSFEGWKRFFMEAIFFLESRYFHDISISLGSIEHKSLGEQQSYHDGIIKFGPNLTDNKIFQMIKNNSEFVQKNIVSLYRGVNDKNVRLQLGGFEQSFARGLNNGILFYQLSLLADDGKWKIPVKSIACLRQKNGREDTFFVANSDISLGISVQSPILKLPRRFSSDIERNFETPHTNCKVTQNSRLSCDNLTSVDLSLNYIQFKIDDGAYLNISLYDLRDTYDEKTKDTVFFIQFIDSESEIQLGEALFKSYYVSIDMQNKKMLYSPLNRFPSESYGKYILRFLIAFCVFTVAVAFFAMLWQMFNDPFQKNKLMYGQDGVRLVSYQRANDVDQF